MAVTVSVSMCVCKCTDLSEVEVGFEAMEATGAPPEGGEEATGDTSTSYDGVTRDCRRGTGVFLTSQSTVES